MTFIPGLMIPVSTLPTGTVPIPPILQTSYNGNLNGFSVGLVGGTIKSNASFSIGVAGIGHASGSDVLVHGGGGADSGLGGEGAGAGDKSEGEGELHGGNWW